MSQVNDNPEDCEEELRNLRTQIFKMQVAADKIGIPTALDIGLMPKMTVDGKVYILLRLRRDETVQDS